MNTASHKRQISRVDNAIRSLNGGRLPRFSVILTVVNQTIVLGDGDAVTPYDGTPETAIEIVRRRCALAGRKITSITVRLDGDQPISRVVPMFYQGRVEWTEEV